MPKKRSQDLGKVPRLAAKSGGVKELRSWKARRAFIDALKGTNVHPKIVQELLGHATVYPALHTTRKGE